MAKVATDYSKLTLDDLTRDELLWYIRNKTLFYAPKIKDMLEARWHAMSAKASRDMKTACDKSDQIGPIKTPDQRVAWFKAQKEFDRASELAQEAQIVFQAMMEAK